MKKVLLHYPMWNNRWENPILEQLCDYDLTVSHSNDLEEIKKLSSDKDILISMWCSSVVNMWTHEFPNKKIITYLRRYELWEETLMAKPNWTVVNHMIFVSPWCKEMANMMWEQNHIIAPLYQSVIPNGIDMSGFALRKERTGTGKIAMVCSLKEVKNIPLAFQILTELPDKYSLHHIGLPYSTQNLGQIMSYANNLNVADRIHFNGHIMRDNVPEWLMDKDYILSTSINEGNPNNVIEAMAMGIKPVIHNWPGARNQFPNDLIFEKITGAIDIITGESYFPQSYRNWVETKYSLDNFKKFKEIVDECCKEK